MFVCLFAWLFVCLFVCLQSSQARSSCPNHLMLASTQVIPTWRLVLEPGCEVQKLAAIEAELQTLRTLGRHPNLALASGHMRNHGQMMSQLKNEAGLIATATINRVDQTGKVRPHYKLVVMEASDFSIGRLQVCLSARFWFPSKLAAYSIFWSEAINQKSVTWER